MALRDTKITDDLSATFREFVLIPRLTLQKHSWSEVSLSTHLAGKLPLAIPFLSAAMSAVTGVELSIALALEGGLGVLPAGKVDIAQQVANLKAVKQFRLGFTTPPPTVRPSTRLADLQRLETSENRTAFAVTDQKGTLLGLISNQDYHPILDLKLNVVDRMIKAQDLKTACSRQTLAECADILVQERLPALCIVDTDNTLESMVYFADLKLHGLYPNATRDTSGRLRVAAAVSTHPEDIERARLCAQAGADAICIDASDGFSEFMRTTIEKSKAFGIPIVAGNVVDAAGFQYLAESGADAVKVGIGSGSICTTRRVKSIGRGQATALRAVAMARDLWAQKTNKYLPIISDGGIEGTGDMAVALAMGADLLMMGKYFAGFTESPTDCLTKPVQALVSGQHTTIPLTLKPYWGEASVRAKNVRRYQQDDPRTFVIEGEEGYVAWKGSLHDNLIKDVRAIRSTLSSCGCTNLEEFRRDVSLERQSLGSQSEGGTSIFIG